MFQAEIHLQQDKDCVVSRLAAEFETEIDIEIEELHDELVTFLLTYNGALDGALEILEKSQQVRHVEDLDAQTFLVTKRSCGAYSAIERNHAIIRRRNFIGPNRRVYTVLFFRREDLRAMIEDFREIGQVTLGKVTQINNAGARLTDRQHEVVAEALESGYFEWPREITSDELAEQMEISRATLLEHLRKAESKLLTDALERQTSERDRPERTEPLEPPM